MYGYVSMEIELIILKPKELAEAIEPLQNDLNGDWKDIRLESTDVKDGVMYFIELDDFDRDADDDFDLLFETIAPFVSGKILFKSEDELYCEEFDGNGNHVYQDSSIFYGFCSYKQFMEEYKKHLPEKLKTELEQWWIARRI